uniref:Tubulin-specific chaperone cofactor E-like protein n=1 Tax=Neogobius melanostomus TaxID=47308 RepID=A0A8C6SI63_9GOBI
MESSSDEEEVHTFVQVVSDKYNPDNFPYSRGQGLGIVLLPTQPGSPVTDRLFLPSVLVLNDCSIQKAGDAADIAAVCAHVVELDLSHNQLSDWEEVSTIVSNIPHLDFVNLSMNPLQGAQLDTGLAQSFSRVRRLVLINTHIKLEPMCHPPLTRTSQLVSKT